MSKKKSKMYNVNQQKRKDKNIMKLNIREIQMNLPGLNRNDGIVKTGTGRWQDKKKKNIDKIHKKEMSDFKNPTFLFFYKLLKLFILSLNFIFVFFSKHSCSSIIKFNRNLLSFILYV